MLKSGSPRAGADVCDKLDLANYRLNWGAGTGGSVAGETRSGTAGNFLLRIGCPTIPGKGFPGGGRAEL